MFYDPWMSMYVGLTSQESLKPECFRFLAQGNTPTAPAMKLMGHKGKRPVLVKGPVLPPDSQGSQWVGQKQNQKRREWHAGDHLWGSELEDQFGFCYEEVYFSSYLGNALILEAMLQQQFNGLALGYRRLWRRSTDSPCHCNPDKVGVHRVFLTWSTKVHQAVVAGPMIIKK